MSSARSKLIDARHYFNRDVIKRSKINIVHIEWGLKYTGALAKDLPLGLCRRHRTWRFYSCQRLSLEIKKARRMTDQVTDRLCFSTITGNIIRIGIGWLSSPVHPSRDMAFLAVSWMGSANSEPSYWLYIRSTHFPDQLLTQECFQSTERIVLILHGEYLSKTEVSDYLRREKDNFPNPECGPPSKLRFYSSLTSCSFDLWDDSAFQKDARYFVNTNNLREDLDRGKDPEIKYLKEEYLDSGSSKRLVYMANIGTVACLTMRHWISVSFKPTRTCAQWCLDSEGSSWFLCGKEEQM